MSKTTRLALSLVLVGVIGAVLASSACAATYTVGNPNDTSGSCGSPPAGKCSLRQLIEYEDSLSSTPNPADTIVVPKGTYHLSKGELVITQSLNIVGAGASTTVVNIAAEAIHGRVFDIKAAAGHSPPKVTISGLEIAGGTAGESNGYYGGDVYSSGNLLLEEDWITDGTASSGGGVSNDTGTMVVERSLVSQNEASTGGGDSGAIQNHGSAVCEFIEETEEFVCSPGKKAVLTVEDSTIAYNDARLGAGIFSWSEEGVADGNEVSVIDSTVAYNETKEESDSQPLGPGAGLLVSEGKADVAGSILAYNYEIDDEGEFLLSNCATSQSGAIASLGYNLEDGTECGFKATGDLQNGDPEFSSAEPADNGGDTDTLAPEPTSPVVDAIPTSFRYCDGADQRGVSRPQGVGCDIGAVELVPRTIEATEGSSFSGVLASVTRCGIERTPTIEWGDGTKSNGTVNDDDEISGTHTYAQAGTYNGIVKYEDDCGTFKVHFQAKVADAPLTAKGEAIRATTGTQFQGTVATFTDANPDGKASEYTASIEWGDGTSSAGTIAASGKGFAVAGAHTYAPAGEYTTTVTIDDVGGSKATATGSATVTGPPIVSNVTVVSVTETTATIDFTIDPDGADTSYVVDYGHTTSYGLSTAPVNIGSAPGPQHLTVTLTGLEPGGSYHFDVIATNSQVAEGVGGGDQPFSTPAAPSSGVLGSKTSSTGTGSPGGGAPPLPPPVLGESVNVELVSGTVLISLPPTGHMSLAAPLETAFASLSKGLHFIPLTQARQIPVGSTLEATSGVARITAATATVGKTQSGEFGAGIFEVLQGRKQKGLTEMKIVDGRSRRQVCASVGKKAAVAAKLSSKTLGRLNANAHGSFSTHGQYSAAAVRGTVWTVANQCDGTLTKVTRGEVSVRDFRRRKTITLFSGQHYLAKAPA